MKKQDKLFDLLKRNGWEQKDTIEAEGISYRFKQYEYYKDNAYNNCYYALGRLDALGIPCICKRIYVQKEGLTMHHASNSRTEKAIRHEINQTSKRINRLCEEIDSLRARCYWYRHRGEICNLEETKDRIEWRVSKLRKAINRRNKLGRELNEKIHKAG